MAGDPIGDRLTNSGERGVLAADTLLAGRYRIIELLGTGGMGLVYRANDEALGLMVAIKVLRADLARDQVWIGRLKRELLLGRQVSHPNVVRIHDIGRDGAIVFLSMDLVPGRSLADLLAEEGRLPPSRAAEIARQIALALEAAHRAGIVHRDVKPNNVLIDESRAPLHVAITDFGIARSLSWSGQTLPGAAVGTPGYLSPEQARGAALDGRSDLYSVGLLLYEMLTGRPSLARTAAGGMRDPDWPEGVPAFLRSVVGRLLAHDPADRPQTAGEVARLLEPYCAGRSHPRIGRRLVVSVCVLLGSLGVALGVGVVKRPAAESGGREATASREARSSIAFLPLADETGQRDLSWIALGLPELLAAGLSEVPGLLVLDTARVGRTLEDLKLPRGPLPVPVARQLAELLDADQLITGRVERVGGKVRIELLLQTADDAQPALASFQVETTEQDIPGLVDQLGGLLGQHFSVPKNIRLELAPSRSVAALAEQARGAELLRRGDALRAVPYLERAVAADPRYTAAWETLARAREQLGRIAEAREAMRHGVATLGAGGSRTAYRVRALEARLEGRPERSLEMLSRLLARYPDDVETRLEQAEAYAGQGSLGPAIEALHEILRRSPHHARAWYLLGKYSILAGDARRAVDEYLPRALVVHNDLRCEQGRADVLNAFGVAYRNLGEMDQAVESYEAAAAMRQRIGDERGYAQAQRNLAVLQMMRGEQAEARKRLAEALAILQALGDTAGIADLQNDFGVLAEQRGDYKEALERYRQALRLRRDLGDRRLLAQSLGNVGLVYSVLGRYEDALVYCRQALDHAEMSGDRSSVVAARQNLGLLELAGGSWDTAVESYLSALTLSREIGFKEAIPVSLGHLGRLAQLQGRPRTSIAFYEEALEVLREIGEQRGTVEVQLFAAETELELGDVGAASKRLRIVEELLERGENHEQRAELERLRGLLLLSQGRREESRQAFRRALAEAGESGNPATLLAAHLSEAGAAGRVSLAKMEALYAEAEELGHARLRLQSAEEVVRAALAAGDAERAREVARDGLRIAAAGGGYAGAYRLHELLAQALVKSGQAAEAAEESRRAREELTRLAQDLSPEMRRLIDPASGLGKKKDRKI